MKFKSSVCPWATEKRPLSGTLVPPQVLFCGGFCETTLKPLPQVSLPVLSH